MKARYLILKNNKEEAADCFERVGFFFRLHVASGDKQKIFDLFVPGTPNVFPTFQLFILQTREFLLQEESKSVKLSHCKHDNYITISKYNFNTQKIILQGLFTLIVFSPCPILSPLKFSIMPMVTVDNGQNE